MTQPLPYRRGLRVLRFAVPVLMLLLVAWFAVLKPAPVSVHTVAPGPVVAEVMGTGTLEARVKVALSPKIQGRLAEVLVDQNDVVRQGQLLARLDDGELRQQVEMARAALASSRATVQRVRADQGRAEAVVSLTRLDHERMSELLKTNAVPQADFDKAVQGLRVAEADLSRAQFAIVEAERQVAAAEQALLYHEERLADTRLLSPFDGIVVKRNRDAGDVVVPGSAVLDLVATAEIWVSAWVDETAMTGLAPGQQARVVFRSDAKRTFEGEVARLGRQTDPETREFVVDVRVTALPPHWTIGQRAEVYIMTGKTEGRAVIPAAALHVQDGRSGVFVSERGRARWRPVDLGMRGRNRVEVVRGLAAGETIVTGSSPRKPLADGMRITPR